MGDPKTHVTRRFGGGPRGIPDGVCGAPCRRSRIGGIAQLMMLSVGTERETDADVYARHAPELVRFATVLAGPSGADDLVASAVLKAFTNPGWSGVQNQRAYLYRAVLNEARQEGRANVRRLRREQLAAESERSDSASVRPEVLAAMRRLDPRQRAIVFFTYWHDRTPNEIADDLGVNVRTVQRELASARQQLLEDLR
ncbi:MAG: putative polymerase subfamily sigma factor [Desertimonas sp.]|nr:putative polymerase subfamily sigma factor [Desertimonas sp.]